MLSNERQAASRLVVARHEHVLQQVAEKGLDRPLIAALHFEAIGERAKVVDRVGALGEQEASRIAVLRAGRFEFLE